GRSGKEDGLDVVWHGRRYRVRPPAGMRPPAFLVLQGLAEPPPGDAVLVLPRRATLLDLVRRALPATQRTVTAQPLDGYARRARDAGPGVLLEARGRRDGGRGTADAGCEGLRSGGRGDRRSPGSRAGCLQGAGRGRGTGTRVWVT